MGSSKILIKTVERAEKEVKELLAEVKAGRVNTIEMVTGLKEVQGELKILDIHVHKYENEDE
jgi:hypothetical protein